jgi:hypothetical protein
MGRLYAITFENVAVTTSVDFFEITPADDRPVIIHALHLSQSTDVGDAAEEMMRVQILRGHTTGGSGGAAPTPAPLNPVDAAASFTAETNNTTIASAGTTVSLYAEAFNIRSGLVQIWPPELRPIVTQANTTLVVRLLSTPADSISFSGTLYVEEI